MNVDTIKDGKLLAVVSYLPIFGVVIAYFLNNDKKNVFTSFHLRQALGVWLFYFVCALSIKNFDSATLRLCLWIGFGSLILYGMFTALSGIAKPLPLFGVLFQKWFQNLGK